MTKHITCVSYGDTRIDIESAPLCPHCDQPMFENEPLTLVFIDGRGHGNVAALVHSDCEEMLDEEDEDADSGD